MRLNNNIEAVWLSVNVLVCIMLFPGVGLELLHNTTQWSQAPVVEQLSIDGGLLQIFLQFLLINLQKREDIRGLVSEREKKKKKKPYRSQLGEDTEGQRNHHPQDQCSAHVA